MLEKYLYRAKCCEGTSAGNWVKGYIVPSADGKLCRMKFYKDGDDYLYTCYVDPDTIGRCTGVRDNKGTLIYVKKGFGWDANPWVWVYTFEKVGANETA